jgi:hypothetical protein
MPGLLGQHCEAAHKGAANTENMNMHSCVQKWNGVILPDRAVFLHMLPAQIDATRQLWD